MKENEFQKYKKGIGEVFARKFKQIKNVSERNSYILSM
jgi:hypothetical protein